MSYDIFNRDIYDNQVKKGKQSITDNAKDLAHKIIADHRVQELSLEKKEKISMAIKDFENTHKGQNYAETRLCPG